MQFFLSESTVFAVLVYLYGFIIHLNTMLANIKANSW